MSKEGFVSRVFVFLNEVADVENGNSEKRGPRWDGAETGVGH